MQIEEKSLYQQGYDACIDAKDVRVLEGQLMGMNDDDIDEYCRGWIDATVDQFLKELRGDLLSMHEDDQATAMTMIKFVMVGIRTDRNDATNQKI